MLKNQDEAPEKVRIRNNYREKILAEAKQLDKTYLETLHFIIDCYFAFKKGVLTIQPGMPYPPAFNQVDISPSQFQQSVSPVSTHPEQQDSGNETFALDFDL